MKANNALTTTATPSAPKKLMIAMRLQVEITLIGWVFP